MPSGTIPNLPLGFRFPWDHTSGTLQHDGGQRILHGGQEGLEQTIAPPLVGGVTYEFSAGVAPNVMKVHLLRWSLALLTAPHWVLSRPPEAALGGSRLPSWQRQARPHLLST